MGLALHIFRKDVRRLWWEAAVSLGLLAALARMDSTRFDAIPGPAEGLFNLLLPLAWCYLIALLIQEEPPVGDNQFWVTRPYRRTALLAAKAQFLVLFIHLPSILADAMVLHAHGFQPLGWLPQLLSKQVLLAAALTLPAAALAAMTRNVQHFLLSAVVIAGCAIALTATGTVFSRRWIPADNARLGIVTFAVAAAGIAILLIRYRGRRTALSRIIAVGAALFAGALFVYLPRQYTSAIQCALAPAAIEASRVSVRLTPDKFPSRGRQIGSNHELFQIPLTISGMRGVDEVLWEPLSSEISGTRGGCWRMATAARRAGDVRDSGFASLATQGDNAGWLMLSLHPALFGRFKDDKVAVKGRFAAMVLRKAEPVRLRIGESVLAERGAGRCTSFLVHDDWVPTVTREMLKVVCESPGEIPLISRVRLVQPESGREWNQRLGDSMPHISYPAQAWLSPIDRRQTFFHIIDEVRMDEGSRWLVPREFLPGAVLEIAAEKTAGCVIVDFEIRDLALSAFRVK